MRYKEDNYLLTVSEVAKILQLSKLTVYKFIKENSLEAVVLGSHYRVSPTALSRFINQNSTKNHE